MEVLADVDALPREDRERLVHDVVAQLDELTVLITDLVDLARGDERVEVTQDVRLDLLVAEAVERARRHASDKRFELDLQPTPGGRGARALDRAIANLLDNAAKWSPPGGEIEVSVRDGEVTVRDHGPGIDESDLPFVFDRFYRAPAARGLPGSGLGLAIVRQVAVSHGGEVLVERADGGGTRLRLRIPAVLCHRERRQRTAARRGHANQSARSDARRSDRRHAHDRRTEKLPAACVERLAECRLIVHAGDVMTEEALDEIEAIGPPVEAVLGNVDSPELRRRLEPELLLALPDGMKLGVVHDAGPSRAASSASGSASPTPTRSSSVTRTCRCTSGTADFQIFNPGSPTERRRAPYHSMGLARVEPGAICVRAAQAPVT